MWKPCLLPLLWGAISVTTALGQDLKEVTHTDGIYSEKYTVLRKNKDLRHGSYERYRIERGLSQTTQKLWEKGQYQQGERVGLWEFYGPQDEMVQTYDYSHRQLVFTKEYQPDSTPQKVMSQLLVGTDTTFAYLDKPAVPIGGSYRLTFLLMRNLRPSASAMRTPAKGPVMVAYVVDESGRFGPCRLLRSCGNKELDREALRVVNLFGELEWIPATHKGQPVATILTQPVRFLLE